MAYSYKPVFSLSFLLFFSPSLISPVWLWVWNVSIWKGEEGERETENEKDQQQENKGVWERKRDRQWENEGEERLNVREWHQEGGRERETENTAASAQPLASLAGRLGCDGAHMPTCSNRLAPAPSRPVPPSSRRLKRHQGLEAFALLNNSCLLCPPPPTPHYQSSFQKHYSGYEGTIVFFFLFKNDGKALEIEYCSTKAYHYTLQKNSTLEA